MSSSVRLSCRGHVSSRWVTELVPGIGRRAGERYVLEHKGRGERRAPSSGKLGVVLFDRRFWPGLADGTITVAFRRWKRPTVKAGGTLQSPGGLLAIDEVQPISAQDVTDDDACAAGYADRDKVLAALRPEGALYRIRFHRRGDDPRVELRRSTDFDPAELEDLIRVLDRLEWAVPTLRLIAGNPEVVSTDLAGQVGLDRLHFKQRVRRLKAYGLTESLKVGYRLSPRGRGAPRSDGRAGDSPPMTELAPGRAAPAPTGTMALWATTARRTTAVNPQPRPAVGWHDS